MSFKNPFVVEFGRVEETVPWQQMTTKDLPPIEEEPKELDYYPTESVLEDIESDSGSTRPVYSRLEVPLDTFDKARGTYGKHDLKSDSSLNFEEPLHEILSTFFLSIFYLGFSLGIAFWHRAEGRHVQAELTLVILVCSAIIVHLTFFFNRILSKARIWDKCKVLAILALIPGTLTIVMSFADVVFGIKEAKDRCYVRPWKNTHVIYLVESLVLVIPQCVAQAVFLLEDPVSIPKIKGLFILFCLGVLTLGMTLARIRFDSAHRPDRFGSGMDKFIRSGVIWGNKGLWVTTVSLLVVTVRLMYPDSATHTVAAILILIVTYEVPVLLSYTTVCRSYIAKFSGVFFLIPQFVSLLVLILWVNTDDTVYLTNVGICAMGAFSWFESLTLIGWLLDGCNDREIDILPLYPHFFGDTYESACCKRDRNY